MIEGLRIYCQLYRFNSDIAIKECSLFNLNQRIAVGNKIELTEYLIQDRDVVLSYSKPIMDKVNDLITLQGEAGSLNLSLSGIKNNGIMKDYFNIYRIDIDISRHIYEIEVLYLRKIIWIGYVNQDNIKLSSNDEILELSCISIDKEFERYYSNKEAIPHEDMFYGGHPLPWKDSNKNFINRENAVAISLDRFIRRLIGTGIFETHYSYGISRQEYEVNNIPQFHIRGDTNFWWMRSGYAFYQRSGFSPYQMLRSVCNSMGWQYKINKTQGVRYTFFLANRAEFTNNIFEIDFSNSVLNYSTTYATNIPEADYIIIPDGQIMTGIGFYNSQGLPFAMITNKLTPQNETKFFDYVEYNPDGNVVYRLYPFPSEGRGYQYENTRAINKFEWADIHYRYSAFNHDINWNTIRVVFKKFIKDEKIIYIDGGIADEMCMVNATDGSNDIYNPNQLTARRIAYKGNAGDLIFKRQGFTLLSTYNDYIKTEQFKLNFIDILNVSSGQVISIEVNQLITDDNIVIKFHNIFGEPREINFFSNSEFAVADREINFTKQKTKLLLIRK